MEYVIIALLIIILIALIITIYLLLNRKDTNKDEINSLISKNINELLPTITSTIGSKNEVFTNNINKDVNSVKESVDSVKKEFDNFKETINKKLMDETKESGQRKEEIKNTLDTNLTKLQESLKEAIVEFKGDTKTSIKELKDDVAKSFKDIREDNSKKLQEINNSVNEKLQSTLESKLKDSFDNVIKQITSVNQTVGEIKGLASDVSSLKDVLANVKTKGIIGEVILGNIIRDFLTVGQYEENAITKKNSKERVEFAIKMPGNDDSYVLLPVDSKFPYESYSKILESKDLDEIEESKKELRSKLLKYAKDVSEKYIDAPNTTDFAIIFLPLEGLYLEALKMGLFEEIQSKYKVNLTGPTTFTAFVTSLQVGFKSLMIQKKSADVFKLLQAVKTEFNKFSLALEKTKKKFNEASDELEDLVGTRTRLMNSKLKSIDTMSEEEAAKLIEE